MNKDREKILSFARELWKDGEITREKLDETYCNLYIKK